MNCFIKVYDPDAGDQITVIKYSIDTDLSTDLASAKNVLNIDPSLPRAAQNSSPGETFAFNIKPFNNYPALSDGPHTLFIYVQDDKGGVGTATVSFIADRTPPTLMGTLKQVVSKNSYVKLNFSASDPSSGVILEYYCAGLTGSGMNAVESPPIFLDSTQAAYGEGKLITGTVQATDPVGNSMTQPIKIKIDSSGATSPGSL
ncbi:hypothetical protein V6C32_10910 [Desulforamulus ruminis]|uniref:hypothetical protein n=1 Tax=Desulforamulus ruminis TaxID=1564 RepID=UPI002FD8BD17